MLRGRRGLLERSLSVDTVVAGGAKAVVTLVTQLFFVVILD